MTLHKVTNTIVTQCVGNIVACTDYYFTYISCEGMQQLLSQKGCAKNFLILILKKSSFNNVSFKHVN